LLPSSADNKTYDEGLALPAGGPARSTRAATQLSSRLDSENYNVKAYRKRNRSSTRHHKLLQSTEVLTELGRIDLTQRTQGATEALSARRLSATAAVRKRPRGGEREFPGFTKTARTKHNSVLEEPLF
jgi:hypothetical protein